MDTANDKIANKELRKEKRERLLDIIEKRKDERRRNAAKDREKQILRKVKNKIQTNRRIHTRKLVIDSTKCVEIEKQANIGKAAKITLNPIFKSFP